MDRGSEKAVFDFGDYKGQIVSDLFGKEQYFADSDAFWAAQNVVIEARCEDYLDAGWPDVVIVPRGDYFSAWEYRKVPKRKGGRSEEHTSELQSLMRISSAVFCLKKKNHQYNMPRYH